MMLKHRGRAPLTRQKPTFQRPKALGTFLTRAKAGIMIICRRCGMAKRDGAFESPAQL